MGDSGIENRGTNQDQGISVSWVSGGDFGDGFRENRISCFGAGSLAFTSTVGDISKIVITAGRVSAYELGSGWAATRSALTWSGTASNVVTLSWSDSIYASSISKIEFTIGSPENSVIITAGSNMTKTETSGEASQTGLTGAMTDVVYTANEGYYFPENYSVTAVNGISVTRNSYTQITVSGTPTADATIALTAPTAKTKPDAPTTAAATDCTTAANNDGKLTGITTTMEYKKSDAENWIAGTGSDITGLVPGTYYVRVKATDMALASDNQTLLVDSAWIAPTVAISPAGAGTVKSEKHPDPEQANSWQLTAIPAAGYVFKEWTFTAMERPQSASDNPYAVNKSYLNNGTIINLTAVFEATATPANIIKAPAAKSLTYNGSTQALVTAGEAEGGTMYYAVTTEDKAPTDENLYTTSIPAKTNAGTYYVWYKAVGDRNHLDSEPVCVSVKISEENNPGDVNVEPRTKGIVPKITVEASEYKKIKEAAPNLLTSEEVNRVKNGENLTIFLKMENIDKTVSSSDKALVKEAAAGRNAEIGMYLDLSLYKKIGNSAEKPITDLKGQKITVKVTVPPDYKAPAGTTRTFYAIRVHDGEADVIAESTNTTIEVSTDRFSTYALAYSDKKNTSQKTSGTGSSGSYSASGSTTTSGSYYSTSSGGGSGSSSYGRKTFFVKNVEYRIVSGKKKTVTFAWAMGKKTVKIPATIKRKNQTYKVVGIDADAFRECRGIREVWIGENVKQIGKNAFSGCKRLRKLTIKSRKLTAKKIGKNAFKGVSAKLVLPADSENYKAMLRAKGLRIRN